MTIRTLALTLLSASLLSTSALAEPVGTHVDYGGPRAVPHEHGDIYSVEFRPKLTQVICRLDPGPRLALGVSAFQVGRSAVPVTVSVTPSERKPGLWAALRGFMS